VYKSVITKNMNSVDGVPLLRYFQLMAISFNKIYLYTPYKVQNALFIELHKKTKHVMILIIKSATVVLLINGFIT